MCSGKQGSNRVTSTDVMSCLRDLNQSYADTRTRAITYEHPRIK
jgi:hypothetical protein